MIRGRFFQFCALFNVVFVVSISFACDNKADYDDIVRNAKNSPILIGRKITEIRYNPYDVTSDESGFNLDWNEWQGFVNCAHHFINNNYKNGLQKEYLPLLDKVRYDVEYVAFSDLPDLMTDKGKQYFDNWIKWLSYDNILLNYIRAVALRTIDKNTPSNVQQKSVKKTVYLKPAVIFPKYEDFFKTFYDEQKKKKRLLTPREIKILLESQKLGIVKSGQQTVETRKRITELFAQLEMLRDSLENDNSWFGKSERLRKIEMADRITNAILREYNLIMPYLPNISDESFAKLTTTKDVASLILYAESYALQGIVKQLISYFEKQLSQSKGKK